MALFKFTHQILEGETISVFNYGKHKRDFTYIDDIVEGIVRVLDRPALPNKEWRGDKPDPGSSFVLGEFINIGSSSPVDLMDYIDALEKSLRVPAKKELLPLQPGDVPDTYADVSDLFHEFGYQPTTKIKSKQFC